MLRTKREVQGGNRRKVESQRRERVGGIQEGVQEGKAIKVKEKVRGRGGEERRERGVKSLDLEGQALGLTGMVRSTGKAASGVPISC